MRRIHLPVSLSTVKEGNARAFVALFTCDAIARSVLISLLPLQAYALLGSAQLVSVLYFFVAGIGLAGSLIAPTILQFIERRWLLRAGVGAQLLSSVLFASGTRGGLIAGMCLQIAGASILEIVMNLYLLDHIPRRRLNQFEPLRLLFAGSAFAAGPWLGVYLQTTVMPGLPFMVSAFGMLMLIGIFSQLHLTGEADRGRQAINPLRSVVRFARQPRLLLAWVLAFGRSGWWTTYYIYAPIYAAQAGYGPEVGGAVVSIGMVPMLLVRVWGRLGDRIGLRKLLILGYGLTGIASLTAGLVTGSPVAGLVLICLAACAATIVDGAGNVPFLRAVRPLEREAMTPVFMTFRHLSSLAIPGLCALVLWVLPLRFIFIMAGIMCLATAALSRFIPRRM